MSERSDSERDAELEQLLARYYGLDALERHTGAIYAIDADWRIRYMNAAWGRFAAENGGEPTIGRRYTVGSSLLDAFASETTRAYYVTHYTNCRDTGRVWRHEYDCSSPEIPRRFLQLVYPLSKGHLLIVNSRRMEAAEPTDETGIFLDSYRDTHGLIHQCAHCRRVSTTNDADCWDWVPEWAREIPVTSSHTFCPTCVGFYYPRRQRSRDPH